MVRSLFLRWNYHERTREKQESSEFHSRRVPSTTAKLFWAGLILNDTLGRDKVASIASERIDTLFGLAKRTYSHDPDLAQQYVDVALRIASKCRVRIPKEYRLQVCRRCKSFLVPGRSCRVRMRQRREPHIVITCLVCREVRRIPIGKRPSTVKTKISGT
ncbi:MAG: ribonuclease P protein component 4 [Candidatus Bathyarchaeia archaeon]